MTLFSIIGSSIGSESTFAIIFIFYKRILLIYLARLTSDSKVVRQSGAINLLSV
jgi:hypothetical protein